MKTENQALAVWKHRMSFHTSLDATSANTAVFSDDTSTGFMTSEDRGTPANFVASVYDVTKNLRRGGRT